MDRFWQVGYQPPAPDNLGGWAPLGLSVAGRIAVHQALSLVKVP